jgi:hypothetical protein
MPSLRRYSAAENPAEQISHIRTFWSLAPLLAVILLVSSAQAQVPSSVQAQLQISPDYHLTRTWVKAGCYFRDAEGHDVKAQHVVIDVYLPKGGPSNAPHFETRQHVEDNVHDPDWSGRWDEPWGYGFFYYTVTATYGGRTYRTSFTPTRNGFFEVVKKLKPVLEALAPSVHP